ncbi:Uncharacterized protein BWGO95_01693 [Bacillus mycoides]|uniref:Uncharacterized protein n=1 Tax=Bacillus mycoides TaxID=1405 RepID=A0A1D3ML60_BACMY|nr:Uncharacterized protein BWGO95_01693 [Bacillus mycoides]SCM86673.1 Uncharacterized protein BWAI21_02097 [Bacillus mycoides]
MLVKARLEKANNQWGWTKPPLIKVSLYLSLFYQHYGHLKHFTKEDDL